MVQIILASLLIISLSMVTFTYWYKEIHKKDKTVKQLNKTMSNNKQTMKLYTEEQVKQMIDDAHNGIDGYYDILKKHTPIELPSDEEIEKEALSKYAKNDYAIGVGKTYDEFAKQRLGFIEGSQMVINKIQGVTNEQQ